MGLSPLLIEINPEPLPETLTGLGGVLLVVQTFRSLGLPVRVREHVRIKERERGYDEASTVESFVVLNAVGGECFDDFQRLREDRGLSELIGDGIPSPEAARRFLYQFHAEEKIEEAKPRRRGDEIAYIPEETEALQGLGLVNRALVRKLGRRCWDERIATVDQDATIIESRKQEALRTYEGERGYQPMLAVWGERNVVLADEFRDGNVAAMMDPLTVAKKSFGALPETVTTYYYRGDSASHESGLMNWLRDENRADGPKGFIGFAISARMSEALHKAMGRVPEGAGAVWETACGGDSRMRGSEFRARRKVRAQGHAALALPGDPDSAASGGPDLFSDGTKVKHFAVVTNIQKWKAGRLIEWHREKAGTIQGVHDVLKNELAAGVMPSKYFGTNAAWLRLAVIAHNVMTALKRLALPAESLTARPKRLRFLIFNTPGRLVHHARRIVLRLAMTAARLAEWLEALALLPIRV